MDSAARIAVVGVGNEYRRDDGVGCAVVAGLAALGAHGGLPGGPDLLLCDGDPARLIAFWEGADLAVVVDAAHARPSRPGRVHRLEVSGGRLHSEHPTSSHGLGLGDAVELARELDRLPRRLVVYAVEGADCSLGRGLSAPVRAAVAPLVRRIADEVARYRRGAPDGSPGP
ncbi:hydrogenase maturation protease [Kitasatospora paranensis]|uniref:Hydrogenase maturation protease n=1 Tax=Kitasatospora paranensis TaxID=258053 RepID=A0ABW2FVS9_9ACTN